MLAAALDRDPPHAFFTGTSRAYAGPYHFNLNSGPGPVIVYPSPQARGGPDGTPPAGEPPSGCPRRKEM